MTDSRDYRKFLEAEFRHIRNELEFIKEQTTKTNNRVTHIEDDIIDLKLADATHVVNCPAMPKIDEIKSDLEEYRMIKKYPKIATVIIAIVVMGAIYGFFNNAVHLKRLKNEVDMINTPVQTRSGHIEFWPSGVVIDSLKKQNVK